MNKVSVLIIDDRQKFVERLTKQLNNLYNGNQSNIEKESNYQVSSALSFDEGKSKILKNIDKIDLIFLDYALEPGFGFDLLEEVRTTVKNRGQLCRFEVIVVTHADVEDEALFKYGAIDFLRKPISDINLLNAVKKYHELRRQKEITNIIAPQKLVVNKQTGKYFIDSSGILFIEKMPNVDTVNIVLKKSEYLKLDEEVRDKKQGTDKYFMIKTTTYTINALYTILSASSHSFLKVSQSVIVNKSHVVSCSNDYENIFLLDESDKENGTFRFRKYRVNVGSTYSDGIKLRLTSGLF